ncbi:hypothetical protein L596_025728 [Steinernema carpocapsae]|uniref:Uncharacterized protein n=1 Tax=Steinernema carpocapsae TaxID=34508 RepID=A0A4U5M8L6_STECR|nr:hypothetical protein L596_025728 [Steinernema carpocapsae]
MTNKYLALVCIFAYILFLNIENSIGFSCRINNANVDWWVAKSHDSFVERTGHFFTASSISSDEWSRNMDVNLYNLDASNPVFNTVDQVTNGFQYSVNDLLIFYNDQANRTWSAGKVYGVPKEDSGDEGHSKGVVLYDGILHQGFLLMHSAPGFPFPEAEEFLYPRSAAAYGQLFFCLSINEEQLRMIGELMRMANIYAYEHHFGDSLRTKFRDLFYAVYGEFDLNFVKDIFLAVAENLQSELYVQSFLTESSASFKSVEQAGCKNSDQDPFIVKNIYNATFTASDHTAHKQRTSTDHAKYAITKLPSDNWFCASDINRTKPQLERGGLVICVQDDNLHALFQKSVMVITDCAAVRQANIKHP